MSILFCLVSLLVASLGGMIVGIDPGDPRVVEYQSLFWTIIGIGFVPAVIEFACDEYMVFMSCRKKRLRFIEVKDRRGAEALC